METHKRLQKARNEKGMTQTQVAKELGMKQPHYAVFETGAREIPREKLIALAKLLNVPADYILGLTDEMKPYPPAGEETKADMKNSININGGKNNNITFGNVNMK